jgi:flagellar protein FlgJ
MLAAAQTPEQRQMLLSQPGFQEAAQALGIPPEALTVENADTIIGAAVGAANAMKMRAGPEPTTSQRDYQFYAQQEQQAGRQPLSFNEWDTQGKQAAANQVNLNTGEGDKFYETLDKGQASMFQTLMDEGVAAGRTMQQIDRLGDILDSTPTGAGAAFKTLLGEYGIATDGLDDLQAAQALINQIVPQQRQPGSGPMSDADLALFKQSVPRLINQPGGNQIIIDRMRAISQYQMQQAQIASAVANRQMTPAQGRDALSQLANPLDGMSAQVSGSRTSGGASGSQAQTGQQETTAPPDYLNDQDAQLWEFFTPEEKAAVLGSYNQ